MIKQYQSEVRDQYEDYPYPMRDPQKELTALYVTTTEFLGKINHYCFAGNRDLRDSCRYLVAGGGTGDAAIYLAEQLRNTNSEVVYLDISKSSTKIVQERAKIRGLKNIRWEHESLLDLPNLKLGEFDYINCCGVLHHLADPEKGLRALKSVLKDDGAMGIMVYGQVGRTAIYQMQALLRLLHKGVSDMGERIDRTRKVLAALPASNWYKRDEQRWIGELEKAGNIELYDLFLHAQDRAYTVSEIYDWVHACGLELVAMTAFPGQALRYDPSRVVRDEELRKWVTVLPLPAQQAIAELLVGDIKTHTFYLSRRKDTQASIDNPDNVPYYTFKYATGEQLFRGITANPNAPVAVRYSEGSDPVMVKPGPYTRYLFRYIDGKRPLREIIALSQSAISNDTGVQPDTNDLKTALQQIYESFNEAELMYLRHSSIPAFRSGDELLLNKQK